MTRREVRDSDFNGQTIETLEDRARVVVLEHPDIESPVALDASREEVEGIVKVGIKAVRLEIMLFDDPEGEHAIVTMDQRAFNKLLGKNEAQAAELLAEAEPVVVKIGKQAVRNGESVTYATMKHAGEPHRGKTTDEEKALVQGNLAAINERLVEAGKRTIDLSDPEHVARYGLQELAKGRGVTTSEPSSGDGQPSGPGESAKSE
jgi:hypothetical protein